MKKIRWRFDRDFKISVLTELEVGKSLAQIAHEYGIHLSLPCRWKSELAENPENAFRGNGNKYKDPAKIAELERLLGQAHAEIELLKKSLHYDPEEDSRGKTKANVEGRHMIIQEAQSEDLLFPISHSCLALDVSRSGYYEWLKRSEKIPAENSESSDLIEQIQEIALDHPYYGYRRITAEFRITVMWSTTSAC